MLKLRQALDAAGMKDSKNYGFAGFNSDGEGLG
jgi:hypothetical protein